MRKVALITGLGGQDGSILADLLLEKNYHVVGIIRRNATRDLGNAKHLEDKIDIVEGDVTDMSSMLKIIQRCRPNELYHTAAQSHVHTSFEQPLAALDINTKGLVHILEAVKTLGFSTRIFHCSTSEMYGSSPPPQNIDTIFEPQSPYAIAKVASHYFIKLYRKAYKMYCCAGVTFNHECFFSKTPVILKKNNRIDICYISSLVPNRKNHNNDNSNFTKSYDNDNIQIWDGKNFVKLKAVSRRKLSTIDEANRKKIITNTPHGIVYTTPNHNLCNEKLEKVPAIKFVKNDKLAHGEFPKNNENCDSLTISMSKLYGMLCSDGFVGKSIKFTNNSISVQNEFANTLLKCFNFACIRKSSFVSGFGATSTSLNVSGVSANECLNIRNKIYDIKAKHKKVPNEVLNGSLSVKKAFVEGYYLGDGQKTGNGDYKFKSFKTNSPLLAQGLLYILQSVCPKQDFCLSSFEQNGNIYTHVNLNSPHTKSKNWGIAFKKDRAAISKIMVIEEPNQHVFDIETESGFVCAGIGNMIVGNSERRGPNFVTRKITMGVAKALKDPKFKLKLGNLNAKRDWGDAEDYCEGFIMALQPELPDDYIFATGEMHSVKEFCEEAFSCMGLNWEDYVEVDRFFMRPSEVDALCGDYFKTKEKLGWEPKTSFKELVKKMVHHDCNLLGVLPNENTNE